MGVLERGLRKARPSSRASSTCTCTIGPNVRRGQFDRSSLTPELVSVFVELTAQSFWMAVAKVTNDLTREGVV